MFLFGVVFRGRERVQYGNWKQTGGHSGHRPPPNPPPPASGTVKVHIVKDVEEMEYSCFLTNVERVPTLH